MAADKYVEKSILVLEIPSEVESVLDRYKHKGWEATSYSRVAGPPESVRITLRRPAKPEKK